MTNNLVNTFLILAFSASNAFAKTNHHHYGHHGYTHYHQRVKHRQLEPAAPQPQDDLTCVANTIYREARNSDSNLQAVANVAKNRLMRGWGNSYCHVIRTGRFVYQVRHPNPFDYSRAYEIARKVIEDELPDNTGGALYFHSQRLRHPPKWARPQYRTAQIGGNVFYRDKSSDNTTAFD